MLERKSLSRVLETNLKAVIRDYGTPGHALQNPARKDIHVYGGGQFLGTARNTDDALELFERAKNEGHVPASSHIWLEDVSPYSWIP